MPLHFFSLLLFNGMSCFPLLASTFAATQCLLFKDQPRSQAIFYDYNKVSEAARHLQREEVCLAPKGGGPKSILHSMGFGSDEESVADDRVQYRKGDTVIQEEGETVRQYSDVYNHTLALTQGITGEQPLEGVSH